MRVKSLISWSDNMSVGVYELDDEHKFMIAEIGKLYSYRNKLSREALQECLSLLVFHTIEHFSNEENYMKKINFLELSEHIAIHRVFIDKVINLRNKMAENKEFEIKDSDLNEISRWLFNHIMTEDKDYALHAARHPLEEAAKC